MPMLPSTRSATPSAVSRPIWSKATVEILTFKVYADWMTGIDVVLTSFKKV